MAVIIDDQAEPLQPLRIMAVNNLGVELDLGGITQWTRRAVADFKARWVRIDGFSRELEPGNYVAIDTGTEFVKVRIGEDQIVVTVSSAFDKRAYYHLADAGAINSVILNGRSLDIGTEDRHTIEILESIP